MNNLIPLPIPVPPAPILENALGYENPKDFRYLSMWWEPYGDEAMISDGYITLDGHWTGYLAYIHHPVVAPHIYRYNLGDSDIEAEYRLVINLAERKAFVATTRDVVMLLDEQLPKVAETAISYTDLVEQLNQENYPASTTAEIEELMQKNYEAVQRLNDWLDTQIIAVKNNG